MVRKNILLSSTMNLLNICDTVNEFHTILEKRFNII